MHKETLSTWAAVQLAIVHRWIPPTLDLPSFNALPLIHNLTDPAWIWKALLPSPSSAFPEKRGAYKEEPDIRYT